MSTRPEDDPPGRSRHLRTEHLRRDMARRVARGSVVVTVAQITRAVVHVTSIALLARLLAPEAFGLMKMVTAAAVFIEVFRTAGLSTATIQREDITDGQLNSLFWVNVGLGVVATATLAAAGPLLAGFYDEPRILPVTLVFSVNLLLGGAKVQHEALLRRQMRFRALAIIEIGALLAGFGTGLGLALSGFGVWALVGQLLAEHAVSCAGTWGASGWLPGRPRWAEGTRALLGFGGSLTAASMLNRLGAGLDSILLGRVYGDSVVGFYSKAREIMLLPLSEINRPFRVIGLPSLSRTLAEPERYRRSFVRVVEAVTIVAGPLVAVMVLCGDWVIRLALGPQWGETARLLPILGLAGWILPAWNLTGILFITQGRAREHLHFHALDFVAKAGSVLVGLLGGVTGVAIAVAARYYVMLPVFALLAGRRGPVSARDVLGALGFPFVVTASAALALAGLRRVLPAEVPPGLGLPLALVLAVAVVGLLLRGTAHGRRRLEILTDLFRNFRAKKGPAAGEASPGGA